MSLDSLITHLPPNKHRLSSPVITKKVPSDAVAHLQINKSYTEYSQKTAQKIYTMWWSSSRLCPAAKHSIRKASSSGRYSDQVDRICSSTSAA